MKKELVPNDPAPIGATHLRRLLYAIIKSHQDRLIRNGAIPDGKRLSARFPRPSVEMDTCVIDESDLGFDSLARLELVAELTNRFDLAETGVEDYFLVRRRIGDWLELLTWHLSECAAKITFGFASSGSTGKPKWAYHTRVGLIGEVQAALSGPLADTSPRRVLSLVPPHHIYGFIWTVLLPEFAGLEVLEFAAGLPSRAMRCAQPGDLIVATPFGWDQFAGLEKTLPPGVSGITSGAPATPETWAAAQHVGIAKLIEIYGASETAGIGWRDTACANFQLASDVASSGGNLFRGGVELAVQDKLAWPGAREFQVLGRRDTVVQVAGVNVNLSHLRDEIIAATGARDAAIRLDGARLKAFIAADRTVTETALHAYLNTLPAAARPSHIDWGRELPRTPEGKLRDWVPA